MSTTMHLLAQAWEPSVSTVAPRRVDNDHFDALLSRLRTPNNGSGVPQVIGLTGCGRGVGVSTVAANLAIRAADAGPGSVLLVDADVRPKSPGLNLRIGPGSGRSEMPSGEATCAQDIQATQIESLFLLRAATEPTGKGYELSALAEKLHDLRQQYGFVVVDLPPTDELGSAVDLVSSLDGVVLVIEAGKTHGEGVKRVKRQLIDVRAHLLGAVLNKWRTHVPGWT